MTSRALSTRLRQGVESLLSFAGSPGLARELVPLALGVVLLPWLWIGYRHYAHAAAFRDTTMLVYASWCMLKGERIYDTVITHDGPLCWVVHAIYLLFGGLREEGWRRTDLGMHLLLGAGIGALVPPRALRLDGVRKGVWAVVGAGMWLATLLVYDWPASTQRDPIYAGMGMLGVLLAYRSADCAPRRARWMLLAAALVSSWTVWGKQTAVVYVVLVLVTTLLLPAADAETGAESWRWRLRWVFGGFALSVVTVVVFVAGAGSLRGMWTWYFAYNVLVHRFHDIVAYRTIWTVAYGREPLAITAMVLTGGLAALGRRVLPPRAAGLVLAPALAAVAAVAQHRGWRYHFEPVDLAATVFLLYALATALCAPDDDAPLRRLATSVAAIAMSVVAAWWTLPRLMTSPWLQESEMHLDDDRVTAPKAAAALLAAHTLPTDRVFNFGDDPGVLLFAERLPALPYIVPWLIDMARHVPFTGELEVTGRQGAGVLMFESAVESDVCARLVADPPPAIVTHDGSVGYGDGSQVEALLSFCPIVRPLLASRYHTVLAGPFHVFLRDDRP